MDRRAFLHSSLASLSLVSSPLTASTVSNSEVMRRPFIWVILRGATDSLHSLIPSFESRLTELRPTLHKDALADALPLDKGFLLHKELNFLHTLYGQESLLPVVAVGSGYKARSHFAGQDYLESGLSRAKIDSGWLARAVKARNTNALAVSMRVPISLQGASDKVDTWYPTKLGKSNDNLLSALSTMYEGHDELSSKLQKGLETRSIVRGEVSSTKRIDNFAAICRDCGIFFKHSEALQAAAIELNGWDTHQNQNQRTANMNKKLDNGLAVLKKELGDLWESTVVCVATEFGRTVKENGTQGTDHGTGSHMFFLGGAINGGTIAGKWPGLDETSLFQKRDLLPTSNTFGWIATALKQHWALSDDQVTSIFPNQTGTSMQLIRRENT
ncbi:DUF1501 domain-containing protein [Alteromonas sp. KUL49]|uniref:DUF1501 domain-containing protein n=1 Tax=Alteromonas sp. KUL49 TaxID=2480798 RepID=UPI00102F11C2|nr:DUF1501 domain-containing protein [Alteromonas sp. KUL49]TAP39356.1 DUF1501 domain-containing protein [Alteromonas sp. KUL49]GEA12149.1 hypothetical protein KUL49_25240 [Alteromonas sp. KUL49]